MFTIYRLPLLILAHWLQILEDMEREFGISCPTVPQKDRCQEDILDLETGDSQEEQKQSRGTITQKEEEKNKVEMHYCCSYSFRHSKVERGLLSVVVHVIRTWRRTQFCIL